MTKPWFVPVSSIEYTFHSDANNSISWLDHFFCDSTLASLTLSASPLLYGSNLSDHIPIVVTFDICLSSLSAKPPQPSHTHSSVSTNWAQVSDTHVEQFIASIDSSLPVLLIKFSIVLTLIASSIPLISPNISHISLIVFQLLPPLLYLLFLLQFAHTKCLGGMMLLKV